MNADDRFDVTLRSALRWEADRVARRQPSLDDAVGRVAERVGPEPSLVRPRVVAFPAWRQGQPARRMPALLVIAIVAALLAALAVGSGLVRLPLLQDRDAPLIVPALGHPGACGADIPAGLLIQISFERQAKSINVHEDGRVVTLGSGFGPAPDTGELLTIQGSHTVQQLTDRGLELLLAELDSVGLTPGCRTHAGPRPIYLLARTKAGVTQATFGFEPGLYPGSEVVRVASGKEAAAVALLAERLERPQDWLPPDALVDPEPTAAVPSLWVVHSERVESDRQPGDVFEIEPGRQLHGANPAFADLRMPGGGRLATFECAVVGTDEARDIAASLERVGASEQGTWTIYSEDLSEVYLVSVGSVTPGWEAYGCGPPPEPPAGPTLPPGDLTAVDACTLVDREGAASLLGPHEVEPAEPALNFDVVSPGCRLLSTDGTTPAGPSVLATLYLYGRSVDEATARSLVAGHLGDVVEEVVDGRPIWISSCWEPREVCPGAVAGWSGERLVVLAGTLDVNRATTVISREDARALVGAIVQALGDRGR